MSSYPECLSALASPEIHVMYAQSGDGYSPYPYVVVKVEYIRLM